MLNLTLTLPLPPGDYLTSVELNPTGQILAAGTSSGNVWLWKGLGTEPIVFPSNDNMEVEEIEFSPEGRCVISRSGHPAYFDATVRIWDINTRKELVTYENQFVEFSPDSRYLISKGTRSNTVQLWDAQTGKELASFDGESAKFSPNSLCLASIEDKNVNIWDVQTHKKLMTLSHLHRIGQNSTEATTIAFSPNGRLLAVGSHNNMVHLWDVNTGRELVVLSGHSGNIESVTFSRNGMLLAVGCSFTEGFDEIKDENRLVWLWNLARKESILLKGPSDSIDTDVMFSPDDTLVAGMAVISLGEASDKGEVHIWDTRTGKLLLRLPGWKVKFSSDSSYCATDGGYEDSENFDVWEIGTGKIIASATQVSFSSKWKYAASIDSGNTVSLWQLK